jgi:hypothetical protein
MRSASSSALLCVNSDDSSIAVSWCCGQGVWRKKSRLYDNRWLFLIYMACDTRITFTIKLYLFESYNGVLGQLKCRHRLLTCCMWKLGGHFEKNYKSRCCAKMMFYVLFDNSASALLHSGSVPFSLNYYSFLGNLVIYNLDTWRSIAYAFTSLYVYCIGRTFVLWGAAVLYVEHHEREDCQCSVGVTFCVARVSSASRPHDAACTIFMSPLPC